MAIQVEMWQPNIEEELFRKNNFFNFFSSEDQYVIGGKVVHIPQSGGPAATVRNRATLPATIQTRQDTDILYLIDEFTTDPVRIDNADTVELSYSKMMSVIRENTGGHMEMVGDWGIYNAVKNAVAANKIPTTGTQSASSSSGGTGTRKILTEKDLRAAKIALDKQNVPADRRYILLPPNMLDQLYDDDKLKYAFANVANLETGVIGRYAGFNFLERSKVMDVDASLVPKVPGSANAVDDSEAALFWQEDFLAKAKGDITMFNEYGRPEYYGDIFSFLSRMGGRAKRADNKGYGFIYRDA